VILSTARPTDGSQWRVLESRSPGRQRGDGIVAADAAGTKFSVYIRGTTGNAIAANAAPASTSPRYRSRGQDRREKPQHQHVRNQRPTGLRRKARPRRSSCVTCWKGSARNTSAGCECPLGAQRSTVVGSIVPGSAAPSPPEGHQWPARSNFRATSIVRTRNSPALR